MILNMGYNKSFDYVIAKTLYNNNYDRVKAFKDAAVILGTTSKSIEGRYYRNKETIDNMISHIVYSKKPWDYKLYKTICNFFIKK